MSVLSKKQVLNGVACAMMVGAMGAAVVPNAEAAPKGSFEVAGHHEKNPCAANPCAAKNPCAANPCAANPCAAKNPCAANPCAAKNPCAANPCAANPCAAKKM